MKQIKILSAVLSSLFIFTISSALGETIPRRIISLSPIITETIYLVGGQEELIADTTYCNFPAAAMLKDKIGSVTQMNVEKIIRLHPDLVIASPLSREKQLAMLERQSISVFRAQNPKTFTQMCDMTLTIGQKLGRQEMAQQIVAQSQKEADTILEKTKGLSRPRIFLQIGLKPLYSANKEMFINEYIRYGGGFNITENESSGIYSREKVIAQNPDIIFIATMGTSQKAGELEKQRWMTFKSIAAVQKNQVFVLDPEMICSPTPTSFVMGLKYLLPLIHPELARVARNE